MPALDAAHTRQVCEQFVEERPTLRDARHVLGAETVLDPVTLGEDESFSAFFRIPETRNDKNTVVLA